MIVSDFRRGNLKRRVTLRVEGSTIDPWRGEPDAVTLARLARLVVGGFGVVPSDVPEIVSAWLDINVQPCPDPAMARRVARESEAMSRATEAQPARWARGSTLANPRHYTAICRAARAWHYAHRVADPGQAELGMVRREVAEVLTIVAPVRLTDDVASLLITPLLLEQWGRELGDFNSRGLLARELRHYVAREVADLVMPAELREAV